MPLHAHYSGSQHAHPPSCWQVFICSGFPSAHPLGRRLAANVSGLDEEYFEALEAFEVVQAHDYLVRASTPLPAGSRPAEVDGLVCAASPDELPSPSTAEEDGDSDEADDENGTPPLTARGSPAVGALLISFQKAVANALSAGMLHWS